MGNGEKKDIKLRDYNDLQNTEDNKIYKRSLSLNEELLINWGYRRALQDSKKRARESLNKLYKAKFEYIRILKDKSLTDEKRTKFNGKLQGVSAIILFLQGLYNIEYRGQYE